jgi:HAD superfamily phosphoserine phosphatase-like hydrolase
MQNINNPNLVIYDFCETIVSIQTADRFVDYVADKLNKGRTFSIIEGILIKTRLFAVVNKIYPKFNISKKFNLFKLRGVKEDDLKLLAIKYYNEVIQPSFNKIIVEKLQDDINNQNIVVIVSGGYNPYLEIFCSDYKINYLLSSKIKVANGIVSGFLNGADCMFENKVKYVNDLIKKKQFVYKNTIVYSDSITDLPLFKWANESYVISYNKSQNWAVQNDFNEIIIERYV